MLRREARLAHWLNPVSDGAGGPGYRQEVWTDKINVFIALHC